MKRLYKKRYILPAVLVVLAIGLLWFLTHRAPRLPTYEPATAVRADIVHEVNVTGKVESAKKVSLAFSAGGTIAHVLVAEGDHVEAGDTLLTLDASVLASQLVEAQAGVEREKKVREQIIAGNRSEDVAVTQASYDAAQVAYANAADNLARVIERAYVTVDDAVRNKADTLFQNAKSDQPSFGIDFTQNSTHYTITADNNTRIALNTMRKDISDRLSVWQQENGDTGVALEKKMADAKSNIEFVQSFLTTLAGAINKYSATDPNTQVVYGTYQTAIATARTAVSASLGELQTASDTYASASSSIAVTKRQLELKQAGPTGDAVAVQDAVIERAENAVQTIQAQIAQTTIVSPISGVVTNVDGKRGESVAPNMPIVTVLSPSSFQLVAYIPESDIVQVKEGDTAHVTFDALDQSEVSVAHVAHIEDGETVREGVATYKTTLALDAVDPRIRSGMSADIDITTDTRTQVIVLPQRSVLTEGSRSYVRVPAGATFVEHTVHPGLRGSDGNVEILDGVSEGEKVVLYLGT